MVAKALDQVGEVNRTAVSEKRRDVDILMATPTKHYVRRKVWLPIAARRQRMLDRPIRYFTLTTADLLDVKLLHRAGLIEKTDRGYPGVGYCEKDDMVFAEIARGLRWCGWSHKGLFEDMVLRNPKFDSDFEFDVVNLDFIWVPFPNQESPLAGTWGAIRRMLEVQLRKEKSFDLFLTFRGSREGTSDRAIDEVAELLQDNLQAGRGVSQFRRRIGHADPLRLLGDDYVTFLCLGLPKLLIGDALDLGFQVSRADVYSYPRGTEGEEYQIVKFAIGLEIPTPSPRGFADPPRIVSSYEEAVAEVFAKSVVDVGKVLGSDPELRSCLRDDLDALRIS